MTSALTPDAHTLIEAHRQQHGSGAVREVAALAKTVDAAPLASFAVIREMVHLAVVDPRPQLWLAVLVPRPFAALCASFGELAVRQVGEAIPGYKDVPAASPDLKFIPTVMDPNRVLDAMLLSIRQAATPRERTRIEQTLRFLSAGMPRPGLSAAAATYLKEMARP